MDDKLNEIIQILNKQNTQIDLLTKKIENQNTRLNILELYGNRMDNHIIFIEYLYQSLIRPIEFIKGYFSDNNLYFHKHLNLTNI